MANVCSSHPSTASTALCRDTNEHRNIKLHYTFSHAHSIINSIRISFEVLLSRSLIFYSPDMFTGMAPTSPLTHTQPQDSIFFSLSNIFSTLSWIHFHQYYDIMRNKESLRCAPDRHWTVIDDDYGWSRWSELEKAAKKTPGEAQKVAGDDSAHESLDYTIKASRLAFQNFPSFSLRLNIVDCVEQQSWRLSIDSRKFSHWAIVEYPQRHKMTMRAEARREKKCEKQTKLYWKILSSGECDKRQRENIRCLTQVPV